MGMFVSKTSAEVEPETSSERNPNICVFSTRRFGILLQSSSPFRGNPGAALPMGAGGALPGPGSTAGVWLSDPPATSPLSSTPAKPGACGEAVLRWGSIPSRLHVGELFPGASPRERQLQLWLFPVFLTEQHVLTLGHFGWVDALHLTSQKCWVPADRETEAAWIDSAGTKSGFWVLSFDACLFPKNLDLNKKPGQRFNCGVSAPFWCRWH